MTAEHVVAEARMYGEVAIGGAELRNMTAATSCRCHRAEPLSAVLLFAVMGDPSNLRPGEVPVQVCPNCDSTQICLRHID
jgi:hypothetical protein